MNRLTIKVPNDRHYRTLDTKFIECEAIDKLGRLEDIEEKLGCPIEVLFKAIDDGVYYDCERSYCNGVKTIEQIKFDIQPELSSTNAYGYALNVHIDYAKSLKDYKKTWWLRKDKSE